MSVERGLSCSDKDGVLDSGGDWGDFVGDWLDLQEIVNFFLGFGLRVLGKKMGVFVSGCEIV